MNLRCLASILTGVTAVTSNALGVILMDSPSKNVAAPTGLLAGSGWQYQGQINAFLGTPVSSKYFLSAQHLFSIPFGLTQPFTYGGQTYHPDQAIDIPGTDLRLWRIAETIKKLSGPQ